MSEKVSFYERARRLLHSVFEWLVVSKCPACSAVTRHSGTLCDECLKKYAEEKERKCEFCEMTASDCVCSTRDLEFCPSFGKSLHSYMFYVPSNSVLTSSLYALKRNPDRNAEKMFARELSAELLRLAAENKCDLSEWRVTSPPRGRASVLNYGFDQSKGLAKRVSKLTGAVFEDVFSRRGSEKQKTLDAGGRMRSAKHSFNIRKNISVKGKKYIIIDDVVTTGATAGTCERLLFKSGAESVFVMSIAKTPKIGKGYDRKEERPGPRAKSKDLWFEES